MPYKAWLFNSTGLAGVGSCATILTGALTAGAQKTVAHNLNRTDLLLISRNAADTNNIGVQLLKPAIAPDDPLNEFYITSSIDVAAPGLPIKIAAWN